ncbi:MAG TPA: enoyl-CoA hydratase-related protein [Thermoanaerobaculia bacterium]|nr:enoyl-CoA hydratase-related protein [Thermoanaerobaculia bacterium]
MTFTNLLVDRRDDLLWVTLNNPDRANALSPALLAEVTELYLHPWRSEGVRAILLAGAGKHFCAGADIEHLKSLQGASPDENLEDSRRLRGLFEAVLRQEALTVALVHGWCVAGGCGLATAHDFVVAAEDAKFLYSEVRIGFVAALVATYLPLRLRGSDLRELLINPEPIGGPRAFEIGLANRVAAPGSLHAEGERLATGILEKASSESIARTKRLLLEIYGRPLAERLDLATEANAASRTTEDCRHGMATFLETKAPPKWR